MMPGSVRVASFAILSRSAGAAHLDFNPLFSISYMSAPVAPAKAWVTLLTRTSYLAGCLVLNASLKKANSAYPLVVFATSDLPQEVRQVLESFHIPVHDIEFLEPRDNKVVLAEHDHRFADTWTKLRCFELVQYEVSVERALVVPRGMGEERWGSADPAPPCSGSSCSTPTCSCSRTWTSSSRWTSRMIG